MTRIVLREFEKTPEVLRYTEPGAKLLSPLHVLQRAEVRKEGGCSWCWNQIGSNSRGAFLDSIWDTHPYHSNGSPSMFQG